MCDVITVCQMGLMTKQEKGIRVKDIGNVGNRGK